MKQLKEIILIALFGLFCICMGVLIEQKRPVYKAHVQNDVVTVIEIR